MPSNKARNTYARQWDSLRLAPSRSEGKLASERIKEVSQAGYTISKGRVGRILLDLQSVFGQALSIKRAAHGGSAFGAFFGLLAFKAHIPIYYEFSLATSRIFVNNQLEK